jgi:hypothetical protein
MPRCPNGHTDIWNLYCEKCKTKIDYREAYKELMEAPKLKITCEDTSILFVGFKTFQARDAYICEITVGEQEIVSEKSLTLKRIDGGTWLDYQNEYNEIVNKWLRLMCFGKSRYKVLVVNTISPLSVLALRNQIIDNNVIVISITADISSTPLAKNTSYVALKTAYDKKIPIILAEESYVMNLTCFDEDSGLMVGQLAFQYIISNYIDYIREINGFIKRDKRLGISIHSFSALIAASELVYKNMDTVFDVQSYLESTEISSKNVISINMLALLPKEMFENIEKAFKVFSKKFKVLNSDLALIERDSKYEVYDIHLLYGLNDDPILRKIEEGYEVVANKTPSLSAEVK